mmetsp:Transcript_106996/g.194707  ORF Transcript_106996/g.194707 Transcript_106996/m.194707 type:complete len:223 (+) Transcript_106996:308-976(+)
MARPYEGSKAATMYRRTGASSRTSGASQSNFICRRPGVEQSTLAEGLRGAGGGSRKETALSQHSLASRRISRASATRAQPPALSGCSFSIKARNARETAWAVLQSAPRTANPQAARVLNVLCFSASMRFASAVAVRHRKEASSTRALDVLGGAGAHLEGSAAGGVETSGRGSSCRAALADDLPLCSASKSNLAHSSAPALAWPQPFRAQRLRSSSIGSSRSL